MVAALNADMIARHIEQPLTGSYFKVKLNITDQKIVHVMTTAFSFLVFASAGFFTGIIMAGLTFYATTAVAKYLQYLDKLNDTALNEMRNKRKSQEASKGQVPNPHLKAQMTPSVAKVEIKAEAPEVQKKNESQQTSTMVVPGPNNTPITVNLTSSQTLDPKAV